MIAAGRLTSRVVFRRQYITQRDGGGVDALWADLYRCRGELRMQSGREQIASGRIEAAAGGVLVVRASSETRGITTADSAMIDGDEFQIRSITAHRERVEMVVERGVAV